MKLINKFFIFVLFFIIILKIIPEVSADVIIPNCKWNEIKVSCECKSEEGYFITATNKCSQCLKYKNDPKYYYLWNDIFCRKATILELIDKYKNFVGIPLLITIVFELIVFMIRGYRKIKELLNVILINCISLPIGFLLFPIISLIALFPVRILLSGILRNFFPGLSYYSAEGNLAMILTLLFIEVMVVIFETLFLIYIAKFENRKKVLVTVIVANIISLIFGLGILMALNPFLSTKIL